MKHVYLLLFSILISSSVIAQVQSIQSIRGNDANGIPLLLGDTVTVEGVIMSPDFDSGIGWEFLIHDDTAGVLIISNTEIMTISIGDKIEITGIESNYFGNTTLSPLSITVVSSNKNVWGLGRNYQILEPNEFEEGQIVTLDIDDSCWEIDFNLWDTTIGMLI